MSSEVKNNRKKKMFVAKITKLEEGERRNRIACENFHFVRYMYEEVRFFLARQGFPQQCF